MARVSEHQIEEIRRRADIVEVVGRVVPLRRAGRAQVGLCPFHQEKTPSFHVNPDRQIFKCFGCGKGGDVVKFVMEYHGVEFVEALRLLADQVGIQIQFEIGGSEEPKGLREQLFAINDFAADWFRRCLTAEHEGVLARDYLHRRGIDPEMGRRFGLGFAPDSWDALSGALRSRGFTPERAADAGVLVKSEKGTFYDRFRGRLMFPIRNTAGKVIAFSGRVLVGDDKAKYINSSESRIFTKGQNFYGLDLATDGIRRAGRAILCEGNLDVIMLHQYGFSESLAALGTALTEDHVRRLLRSTNNVFLVFDADEAGQKAMERAMDLFATTDVEPRCVILSAGDDPDSFLRREGADAFAARVAAAPTMLEFVVNRAFAAQSSDATGRARAVNALVPALAKIHNAVMQSTWIRQVAERARVTEAAIRHEMRTLRRPRPEAAGASRPDAREAPRADAEKGILKLMLIHPRFAYPFDEDRLIDLFTRPDLKQLASLVVERCLESQDDREMRIAELVGSLEDSELQDEIAGWAMDEDRIEEKSADLAYVEFRRRLATEHAKRRFDAVADELDRARHDGNEGREMELMVEKRRLRAQIDELAREGSVVS
ncbi:MAG: DNA primase [Deltaproteobacteria bacterium]|nr:DNA primase [Deltaproteobacteria bacterium]